MSTKESAKNIKETEVTADSVVEYLQQNPDFFKDHSELLLTLDFPHDTGDAISLVERQVAQLRQKNSDLNTTLSGFLSNAKTNERMLDQFQVLLCDLIEAESFSDCVTTLEQKFLESFEIDFCKLFLFSSAGEKPPAKTLEKSEEVEIRAYMGGGTVISGKLPNEIRSALLDGEDEILSTALMYLNSRDYRAVLLLGSKDEDHYRTDMSTSFLRYMTASLTALLSRYFD